MTFPIARASRRHVNRLRHHILGQRRWAAALIALALLMKLVMPAGFMADMSGGTIMVELCSTGGPQTIAVAIPGLDHQKKQGEQGAADSLCAFSGLNASSLAGADPILLAIAIAFIVATAFRIAPIGIVRRAAYLRPPLRGPPAAA